MDKTSKTKSCYSVCGRSRLFGSSQDWPGMGNQRILSCCPNNQSSRQETKPFWMGCTASGMAWFYPLAQGQHRRISRVIKLSGTSSGWMENISICRQCSLAQRNSCKTVSQRTCKSYVGVSSAVSPRTQSSGKDMAYDSLRSNYEQILYFSRGNSSINSASAVSLEA